jgi:hypothetical protein
VAASGRIRSRSFKFRKAEWDRFTVEVLVDADTIIAERRAKADAELNKRNLSAWNNISYKDSMGPDAIT